MAECFVRCLLAFVVHQQLDSSNFLHAMYGAVVNSSVVWQVTVHKHVRWRTRYKCSTLHYCMCDGGAAADQLPYSRHACGAKNSHKVRIRKARLVYSPAHAIHVHALQRKAACTSLMCCNACVVGQHYQVLTLSTTQASVLALSASTWLQTLLAGWTWRKPGMFAVGAQFAQREPWKLLSRRSFPACTVHPAVHVGQ